MIELLIVYTLIAMPGFIVMLILYNLKQKEYNKLKLENSGLINKLNVLYDEYGEEMVEVLKKFHSSKDNKKEVVKNEASEVNLTVSLESASTSVEVDEEDIDLTVPLEPVSAPVKVEAIEVVSKKKEKNPTDWINICLIFGVSFIVVATAVFATTNWDYLSTVTKVVTITLGTFLMYGISFIAGKFKLNSTSNAFHFLGLILLFIDIIAFAFFDLLPYPFVFENLFLVLSLALFVLGLGSIYTCYKFRKYGFVISSYLIFFMSFLFLILHFEIDNFFKILIVIIGNIVLLILGVKIKNKKVYDLATIITIVISSLFILSLVSESILLLNDYMYNNILMYVFGVIILLTLRTRYTLILMYLGSTIMLLSSHSFSIQYINYELLFIALSLASIIIVTGVSHISKSNKIHYDIIKYVYMSVSLTVFLIDYSDSVVTFIAMLPIVSLLFIMMYRHKNESLKIIPMIILTICVIKLILVSEFYDNHFVSIVVAGLFILLYIVNFFIKKLYVNLWTDNFFIAMFLLIIPVIYFYNGLTVLNVLLLVSTFIFSIIHILNIKHCYLAQFTSVSSLLMLSLLVTDETSSNILIGYFGNITFVLFTLLGIGAIYLNKLKEDRRDLKIYAEGINVFIFALMIYYLVEFATTADNLLINILINGILGFAVSFFLIKEKMYAKYFASYALVFYVWYSITEVFTTIASIMSISTFSIAMLYSSYTIIALGIIIVVMSQILKLNKYLQEFKYPVYISTVVTLLINILGRTDMNIVFLLFAILTIYFVTYLLISVKMPNWGRSLIAGIWPVIFIFEYRSYILESFNGYTLNILLIGMVLLIVISSHFLKKYFIKNNSINVFLFTTWILILSLDLHSIYLGLLLTFYIVSLYDCYNFKYYNKSIVWLSTAMFTCSILLQNIFYSNYLLLSNVLLILVVILAIGLCLTQFLKSRALLEFKYPIYVGMSSVVLSYTIGVYYLIPIFTLASLLFMYCISFKIINIKTPKRFESLIAGVWGLLFLLEYMNIVTMLFEANMLNVVLIGMAVAIVIVSQLLRQFFNKCAYINVLLLISWILFIDVNLPDMFIGLLFSAYAISLYNLYQFKYYNKIIISISTVTFVLSVYVQHYFVIPTNFIMEYYVSEIILVSVVLYLLWRNVISYTQYVLYAIIFICQAVLIVKASSQDLYINASILLVINVLFMLYAVIKKLVVPFILSIICLSSLVLFFTEDLWRSLTWWAYLFIAGALLIAIAVVNEVKIKKSNKTVSTFTKEKFKGWKL